MSTFPAVLSSSPRIDCCHALRRLLARLESERYLLRPEHLAGRLTVLDHIDALGALEQDACTVCSDSTILIARLRALRSQFEAANRALYASARAEIAVLGTPFTLRRWLMKPAGDGHAQCPRHGPGFDVQDEIVSGVLQFREPGEVLPSPSPEMVPYQPTPVRHVLDLIAAASLSAGDTLVDLGSGLGHVPLLISILTGIRTLGIELQPSYVSRAQECARNLNLSRVRFVAADARSADLSSGTVFYLFSPFTGSILTSVLDRLRKETSRRHIKICSLGPCTRVLDAQTWLKTTAPPNQERIAVFESQ